MAALLALVIDPVRSDHGQDGCQGVVDPSQIDMLCEMGGGVLEAKERSRRHGRGCFSHRPAI